MLVYDWRAESREQYEAVERLVRRYDFVWVKRVADGACEALVLHWGLLHRYTVERDGFSVERETRDLIRRWWWTIAYVAVTVAAVMVALWFVVRTFAGAMGALWFCCIGVFMVVRVTMLRIERACLRVAVPDLNDWVLLQFPYHDD